MIKNFFSEMLKNVLTKGAGPVSIPIVRFT